MCQSQQSPHLPYCVWFVSVTASTAYTVLRSIHPTNSTSVELTKKTRDVGQLRPKLRRRQLTLTELWIPAQDYVFVVTDQAFHTQGDTY